MKMSESMMCSVKTEDSITDPLSLSALVEAICRSLREINTLFLLLDVQLSVPDFGPLDQLGECLQKNAPETLPRAIRPPSPLPGGCRLGLVARPMNGGTVQVLKIFHFESP